MNRWTGFVVFSLLAVAAPLAFGLVDRSWQIAACLVLVIGMLALPARFPLPSRTGRIFWVVLAVILIAKELLPATWFGHFQWREALHGGFNMTLPATNNPEPCRALDGWLELLLALAWFGWVRTLAGEKKMTLLMEWALLGSGVVLALVCFFAPGNQHTGIYEFRIEPGWTGFGPFPNRNHTASFLAMSAVIGCGVVVNAFRRKHYWQLGGAIAAQVLIVIAVLASQSRGGLVAGIVGLLVFLVLVMRKVDGKKALAVGIAVVLLTASTVLIFGGQVLQRFHSQEEGGVSNHLRVLIWENTLSMWKDAPVTGFGLGTFPQVFPLYQELPLEGQTVLHPESSWLLSLVEFGALPLGLMVGATAWMLARHLRGEWRTGRGFSMRASALSAASVLAVHALWDVPGHRWATAGFGLAALAIALPLRAELVSTRRSTALLPLLAGLFWWVGAHWMLPAWSSSTLERVTSHQKGSPYFPLGVLQHEECWFPLSAQLHYEIGARLLHYRGQQDWALQHFQIATRLKSSSWTLPATIAAASGSVSPGISFHFWDIAISRSGHRREEIFNTALQYSRDLPGGEEFWENYAVTHSDLLLASVAQMGAKNGRDAFDQWWKTRAAGPDLSETELKLFPQIFREIGDPARLRQWMKWHPDLESTGYMDWAAMFHAWGADEEAWRLLARHNTEPAFPKLGNLVAEGALESRWIMEPGDFVNAQNLAVRWHEMGDKKHCDLVIVSTAWQPGAPEWFLRKGAFIQARAGKLSEAAGLLLLLPK
ncbi:MAG: O-antigen ligase family protein [Chthoniobacteraceae bacterium]